MAKWTTKPPTESGWYWLWLAAFGYPEIVKFDGVNIFFAGESNYCKLSSLADTARWGPKIEMPEE